MVCKLQSLWCMHITKYGDIQHIKNGLRPQSWCMHITKYGDIQLSASLSASARGVCTSQNMVTYSYLPPLCKLRSGVCTSQNMVTYSESVCQLLLGEVVCKPQNMVTYSRGMLMLRRMGVREP